MRLVLSDNRIQELGRGPFVIADLLRENKIHPHDVLVTWEGRLIPEMTVVEGEGDVRIIRISHGG